jgi:hypothetical protein
MWIVGTRVRMKLGCNMAESGANYAAGGEGGHGAAKTHGVIHRYNIYPYKTASQIRRHNASKFTADMSVRFEKAL